MKPILRKTIVITLIVLCCATFGFVMYLEGYYYRTRPRQPDATTGRIYAQNVKTANDVAQVYLTRAEKLPYEYFGPVCIAFFLSAYLLNDYWKVFRGAGECKKNIYGGNES